MPAKVVSCGANSPITPEAEHCCGSGECSASRTSSRIAEWSWGGRWSFAGWRPEEIFEFYDRRFRGRVEKLIRHALQSGRPLRAVAEEYSRNDSTR